MEYSEAVEILERALVVVSDVLSGGGSYDEEKAGIRIDDIWIAYQKVRNG